jgi:hypothetical protein
VTLVIFGIVQFSSRGGDVNEVTDLVQLRVNDSRGISI